MTWATDVCVPISKLPEAIRSAHAAIKAEGLVAPIIGHVGDGNFHVFFVLDPDSPDEWIRAERVNGRLIDHAVRVGGTCTGEHGVGLGKREALLLEHGEVAVDLMRRVKAAVDPDGILNAGKIFSRNVKPAS